MKLKLFLDLLSLKPKINFMKNEQDEHFNISDFKYKDLYSDVEMPVISFIGHLEVKSQMHCLHMMFK